MKIKLLVLGLALVGTGCGKKKDEPAAGGGSAATGSAAKTVEGKDDKGKPPAEFAAWMPKGTNLAWEQNAWSSRLQMRTSGTMSMAGDPVAIEIKGDKAKVFDGKADHELAFVIESPCSVEFSKEITEGSMKGGRQMMGKKYLVADGKFLVGEGNVGYRKGKAAFVCGSGEHEFVVVDDKGACKSWNKKFGTEWESKDVKCEWTQQDGKDALKIGEGNFGITVIADGDLLKSEQFDQYVKEGYHAAAKSWDEAKAAVTAKVKENDPAEIAKAAGGKVGETNTVASLAATFAADRKSVEGKEVAVTALYLNSNKSTSNGTTTHNVIVVDKQGDMKITLACNLDAEAKDLKQYDKVTVKGIVGEAFDKPSLDKCSVAKAK